MDIEWACSTSHPSGNQVDGLPLVEHTGAGWFSAASQPVNAEMSACSRARALHSSICFAPNFVK